MIKLKSDEQLSELISGKAILLFTANWCPDCRVIEHFLPDIEQDFPDYTLVEVDRDQFLDICIAHDITGIPSFIVYNEKRIKGTFISKLRKTKDEIYDFLNQATNR